MLDDVLFGLINNDEMTELLTNEETVNAFNEIYDRASSEGSIVRSIPYEQAVRYWVVSRALIAGPALVARCAPPFILCGPPPEPEPEEEEEEELDM